MYFSIVQCIGLSINLQVVVLINYLSIHPFHRVLIRGHLDKGEEHVIEIQPAALRDLSKLQTM